MDPVEKRESDETQARLDELIATNERIIRSQAFWPVFWRGVISAIGATIGAALILALVGGALQQALGVRFFRPVAEELLPYVETVRNRGTGGSGSSTPDLPTPNYNQPTPSPSPSVSPETSSSPSPDVSPDVSSDID